MITLLYLGAGWWEVGSGVWEREEELYFLFVPQISCPRKPQYFPLLPLTFRGKELDEGTRGCALSPYGLLAAG